jgi:hypothetical protein
VSTQQIDFGRILHGSRVSEAYTGVTAVEHAGEEGYQANTGNLKTPWTVPFNEGRPPIKKPFGSG